MSTNSKMANNLQPYSDLITNIKNVVISARKYVAYSINKELLQTHWKVGRLIVEREQNDNITEKSRRALLIELSKALTVDIGVGFSRANLFYMRLFYLANENGQTVSDHLTWSHWIELLKLDDPLERSFYEKQSIAENWSVRELKRQKASLLFHRLAVNKNAEGILELSKKGQLFDDEKDIIKSPYILDFLGLSGDKPYSESVLEQKIIDNLQKFLLELGKGFAFVARQFRITLNNKYYKVDLVFYHRILKCFVLIDLKIDDVEHYDIGQMNMYLNYFATEQNVEDDNPPIGIILAKEKDEIMVEYALGGMKNNIFVSKYQLYLPDRQLLESRIRNILEQKDEKNHRDDIG